MDHIAALAASLEEGNPVPISLSLSHTGASSPVGFVSGACPMPSDDSSMDTFIFEDRSDHDDSISLGPCSDDPFISPTDVNHLRFEASFSGSSYPLDIDSIPLVDKNNSLTIDDVGCADVSIYDLNENINLCVETSNANVQNINSFACVESTTLDIAMPIVNNFKSFYYLSFDNGMHIFVGFDARCFHLRVVDPCSDACFISYFFKDLQHHLFQGRMILGNAHKVHTFTFVPNHTPCEQVLCSESPNPKLNNDTYLCLGIPTRDDHVPSTPHIPFSFHDPFFYYVDNDYFLNVLKFQEFGVVIGKDRRNETFTNLSRQKLSLKVVDGDGIVSIIVLNGSGRGRPDDERNELEENLHPSLEIKDPPFGIGVLVLYLLFLTPRIPPQ